MGLLNGVLVHELAIIRLIYSEALRFRYLLRNIQYSFLYGNLQRGGFYKFEVTGDAL